MQKPKPETSEQRVERTTTQSQSHGASRMITEDEIRRAARKVARHKLEGPKKIDESFIARVRIAHVWSTTRPGRWRHFTRGTCYGVRHTAEYETQSYISDKCFAIGALLAGWEPSRDPIHPINVRFRREKAEA